MSSSHPTIVSENELRKFCELALTRAGVDDVDAQTITDALVETDLLGVHTHGVKLLRDYVRRLMAGGSKSQARPCIDRQGPAWAVVDGQDAMGHVAGAFAMKLAIEKANTCGIAYVGVHHTGHFGAAGYYATLAARHGLIGIAMCNDIPSVAAPGSRKAVLGSNPLAYAIPTSGQPILLDMATSTVAGGKVYAAHQRGEPIPDNWIIGPDGLPTTDGSIYPANASLAPMAGHKGYGIALLIETLSGVLSGAATTWNVGSWIWGDLAQPTNHGAAMLAISVETIMPKEKYLERIDALAAEIRSSPTATGVASVLLPGDREWKVRHRQCQEGIALPSDVVAKLQLLAADLNMNTDWLKT